MRLLKLEVENIGPFDQASIEFVADPADRPPVTFITGENGTGKTILLDAIRGALRGALPAERSIGRLNQEGHIRLYHGSGALQGHMSIHIDRSGNGAPTISGGTPSAHESVRAYWRSAMVTDSYAISSLSKPDLNQYMWGNALQGEQRSAEVTQLLCYFDYLRDSREPTEKKAGEALYSIAEQIIRVSLLAGEFSGVRRSTLTPMVRQAGHEVPLANISSGNAYLIQRMMTLLGQMYAIQESSGKPIEALCQTSGVLLIDEAENHLHPIWQKRFLRNVLSVFPNLQIIATTHSPFILASVPGARVYVCRWDGQRCTVSEESEAYANQPVDEILLSAAFDHTQPFGPEISELLGKRKQAIKDGDAAVRRQIEAQLVAKNPEYFSYFGVEQKLQALKEVD